MSFGTGGTSWQINTNTTVSNPWPVSALCMHEVEGDLVVYDDGVLAGYCKSCGTRITLKEVPAGDIPARIRGLLTELMATSGLSEDLMIRIEQVRADMQAMQDQLDEARELMVVTSAVIAKRTR